jgi:DNA-binding transcriptional ArsR family regulator
VTQLAQDRCKMNGEFYRLAEIGSLIGDPARANMLSELMAGRALTAGELAAVARITPQTVSAHLAKLLAARLIRVERQGRHRYVTIASPTVAEMLETMLFVASAQPAVDRRSAKLPRIHAALKRARTCYDHLAGELGVALCDALVERECIHLSDGSAELSARGLEFCDAFGLELAASHGSRRPLCRACLDWSERRTHLAGRFGAALAQRLFALRWIERAAQGRALQLTAAGSVGMRETFGVVLAQVA